MEQGGVVSKYQMWLVILSISDDLGPNVSNPGRTGDHGVVLLNVRRRISNKLVAKRMILE